MIFSRKKNKVNPTSELTSSSEIATAQQDLSFNAGPVADTKKVMPWENAPDFLEVIEARPEDFSETGSFVPKSPVAQPLSLAPEIVDAGELRSSVDGDFVSDANDNGTVAASDGSLSVEDDLSRRFGDDIKSALGSGTVIEGRFKFDSPVRVDGTLSGEVTSSSALIVGPSAVVEGEVRVGSLIVLGCVRGAVVAEDLVEVRAGGVLEADVESTRFSVEDGSRYEGTCRMLTAQDQKIALVAND